MITSIIQGAIMLLAAFGAVEMYRKSEKAQNITSYLAPFMPAMALETTVQVPYSVLARKCKHKLVGSVSYETLYKPHLFMESKIIDTKTSSVKTIYQIWDMEAGEVVLDTESWSKTKGLEEMLILQPPRTQKKHKTISRLHKYKIACALYEKGSLLTIRELAEITGLPKEDVLNAVDAKSEMVLFHTQGDSISLAISDPVLPKMPTTKDAALFAATTSKLKRDLNMVEPKFSEEKILESANLMFPYSYKVKASRTIYVPVTNVVKQDERGKTTVSKHVGTA